MAKPSVELELELLKTNDDETAYLFSDGDTDAWLPRSLIISLNKLDADDEEEGMYLVELPEWLAIEKDLV